MENWNLEILTSSGESGRKWQFFFDQLEPEKKDIHYSPEYTRIYELTYEHRGYCAVFGNDENYILIPFLKKSIKDLPFLEERKDMPEFYDISNPYGYGGPIGKLQKNIDKKNFLNKFLQLFHELCINEGIITEFNSFHPLLNNQEYIKLVDPNLVLKRKPVIYINLERNESELWRNLSRGHQSSINKSRKNGIVVLKEEVSGNALNTFQQLYSETMIRHKAEKRWRFPENYFSNCMKCLGNEKVALFSALSDGERIASFLIIHGFNIAYYHFGGSLERYFHLKANNLLMFEVARWAKDQGYKYYHLGGGYKEGDNLYRYKSGFSKDQAWLHTYQKIHLPKKYESLCNQKDNWDKVHLINNNGNDFFPPYRR